MRLAILAAAAAMCAAGAAYAQPQALMWPSQPAEAAPPDGASQGRVIYVCDRSARTRRGWSREHGELTFVSAEDLARAEVNNESWSSPRCISEAEFQRFERNASGLMQAAARR